MLFTRIDNTLINLLTRYSYFHDSIIKELKILNPDEIDEDGAIIYNSKMNDCVVLKLQQQHIYSTSETEIRLYDVHDFQVLRLASFIIHKLVIRENDSILELSFTGGFEKDDMWFSAKKIELTEVVPIREVDILEDNTPTTSHTHSLTRDTITGNLRSGIARPFSQNSQDSSKE